MRKVKAGVLVGSSAGGAAALLALSAGHLFMVLLQLRIAHAVYPVRCVLVDNAPGDIVLGLPFRRRYDAALPAGYKPRNAPAHGQGMGVTHICLGVPLGYGVSFPGRKFEQQVAPRKPHETEFKQVLRVEKAWKNWRQKGNSSPQKSSRSIWACPACNGLGFASPFPAPLPNAVGSHGCAGLPSS